MLKYKKFGGLFYSAWNSYEQDKKEQEHFEITVKKYPHYYDDFGYILEGSSFNEDEEFNKDFYLYFNERRDLLSKCFMNQGLFIAGTVLKICSLPGSDGHEKHGDKIRTYIVGGTPGCKGEIDEFPDIYDDNFVIEYCLLSDFIEF